MSDYVLKERQDVLLKRLEAIVRESGDDSLSIAPFFKRIIRTMTSGGCSVPHVVEVYSLPYTFVLDVQRYIKESGIVGGSDGN